MQVLVTGATGRVGSRLVPRLLEGGDFVRVLVRKKEQAGLFRQVGVETVFGDLLEPVTLSTAVAGMDAVVHLAAFFRGASEAEARAVNYDGALALAHAARRAGISRFIYVSTNLVYGPGRGRPAVEDDPPQPASDHFYPVTKLAAENALTELFGDRDAALCILRLAFVYGDGDPHLRDAANLMRAWPPAKRLQLVHHADVAQAIRLSLDEPQAGGQIYNVADDTPIPVAYIRRLVGSAESVPATDTGVADPWEGIVDTSKIKDQLGFRLIYPSLYTAEEKQAL